jgi:BMFP domain-containing protein YqiC
MENEQWTIVNAGIDNEILKSIQSDLEELNSNYSSMVSSLKEEIEDSHEKLIQKMRQELEIANKEAEIALKDVLKDLHLLFEMVNVGKKKSETFDLISVENQTLKKRLEELEAQNDSLSRDLLKLKSNGLRELNKNLRTHKAVPFYPGLFGSHPITKG